MLIEIKKLHPDAVIPNQKQGDVGFDLTAIEEIELTPGTVTKVKTGLAIADYDCHVLIPAHELTIYPKIEGRSGLASRGVFPVGGIIDPSYRGELIVALVNFGDAPHLISKGDRVAQLVFYSSMAMPEIVLKEADDVVETSRGAKGFGSSGK